jgi:hypothetical protein
VSGPLELLADARLHGGTCCTTLWAEEAAWPRLGVGGRRAGSSPASSSPSTALCGPPPGTWPRLGVWGRRAGSSPASSSPLTALFGPQPGIRPGLPLWLGRRTLPPALTYGRPSSPPCPTLLLFPTPLSYYLPPHSLSPLTSPSIPMSLSRGPFRTQHTLPGPSCGGDQALLDRGILQRHMIP